MKKKLTMLIVGGLVCLNLSVSAQESTAAVGVGGKLHSSFWTTEHKLYDAGKFFTGTLNAYKDKLMILDFWATWCGSCLSKFPALIELQETYEGVLKVLPINSINTGDDADRVARKLSGKMDPYKRYELPSVIGDSILNSNFPHHAIPHYVWIAEGYVLAITSAEFVTKENVEASLRRIKVLKAGLKLINKGKTR